MAAEWALTKARDIVKGYMLPYGHLRATVEGAFAAALEAERKRNRDIAFGHAQGDERDEDGDGGRVGYEIVKTIEMVEYPCDVCQGKGKLEREQECPICGGSGEIVRKSEAREEA